MQISFYKNEGVLRKWIIVRILMILLVIQSAIIFYFSSQTAQQSGNISRAVMDKLSWLLESVPREKSSSAYAGITLHYIVRKIAHLYNFFVIGCILYSLRRNFDKRVSLDFCWISYGILFAITDEFHQSFVVGRSGRVSDVFIDSTGVLLGYIFVYLLFCVVFSKRCVLWKRKRK